MNILELKQGKTAYIHDIKDIHHIVKQRLLQIGVCEGSLIKMKRMMPFGGPCMIECSGQVIGIRRSDAKKILVNGQ
ncbi:ferrous iron transport protein A [Oikeobacillus pervagus]|uniref:Ferrous iron transport protein A n=1 Tax=Oikeobacillus pervagus TaxID=1325931 RepID=A0AAJ1T1P9_9BACI|nr:FeoA family protein [Oikeobacillus pervagus]MDQ0214329.1 ferrous iron transport protein A [Oikeobacillus pervagus]